MEFGVVLKGLTQSTVRATSQSGRKGWEWIQAAGEGMLLRMVVAAMTAFGHQEFMILT